MAVVVVGGHTRNIGKTSVVAGIIAALPQYHWTAFKITQYGHGLCSAHGEPCACETASHTVAISEEHDAATGTDSARFLQAGAVRSFWVRTRQGYLAEAMPRIRKELERAENAIFESNSVLRFLRPDLYLSVLHPSIADFKPSAQYFLDRADAIVFTSPNTNSTFAWPPKNLPSTGSKPTFLVPQPKFDCTDLSRWIIQRLQIHG